MINIIEKVCLIGNWTQDIPINYKYLEQQLLIQDPYDSIWLKIIAILSYFIGLVSSAIMLATLLIAEILSGKNARAWVSMDFT